MKKIIVWTVFAVGYGALGSCGYDNNNFKVDRVMEKTDVTIFGLGTIAESNFTGEAWVKMLPIDGEFDCSVYNVTFKPGARNYWHKHSVGQVLLCTNGVGVYQERGDNGQIIKAGDVVNIASGVEHWHGAVNEGQFTHIGITPRVGENKTEWLDAVSDVEYSEAVK